MTDDAKIVNFNNTYEAVITFIPKERAIIRIAASSEEMARKAIQEMATDSVTELNIESIAVVNDDDPVPEGFDENPKEVASEEKKVH